MNATRPGGHAVPMPAATKTFLLRAVASFALVLLVNVVSAGAGSIGLLLSVFEALRYALVGAGLFFLVVAASAWGVVLASAEASPDAIRHR